MKVDYKGDEIIIYDFKPAEAYKVARKLELEGINFYNLFLSHCKDAETKKIIEFLLSEEKRHLEIFRKKVDELEGPFEERSIVDEVDTTVFGSFGEPVNLNDIVKNKDKAVRLGMLFEKRSVSFFEACLEKTNDAATQEAFEDVIKEEQKHVEILKGILSKGKTKGGT